MLEETVNNEITLKKWTFKEVLSLLSGFNLKESIFFFDTETTGLNIHKDKAFKVMFKFQQIDKDNIEVKCSDIYSIEINKYTFHALNYLFSKLKDCIYVVGHNTKFDLHMLANWGFNIYDWKNVTDTMIIARLTSTVDEKKMGLKELGTKILEKEDSKEEQDNIKNKKRAILQSHTKVLNQKLKEAGLKIKHTHIRDILKDSPIGVEALDPKVKKIYLDWCKELNYDTPNVFYVPNYFEVYKEHPKDMTRYAKQDVELTYRVFNYLIDWILDNDDLNLKKGRTFIFNLENSLIWPLFRQEREGYFVDKPYLLESAKKLKNLIEEKEKKLSKIAGFTLTANQNKKLIEIFKQKWNIYPKNYKGKESVDEDSLKTLLRSAKEEETKEFVELILDLRTYVKWYKTYIINFVNRINENNKIYTQYNQSGTVSGRISGDFQQMPKEGILDKDGNELFHPRKLIKSDNKDAYLVFADYSQMELILQAEYCIYLFPDLEINLVRAFIPYKCKNKLTNQIYDLDKDRDKIWEKDFWINEKGEVWKPLDLHSLNITKAFGDEIINNPDLYKKLRKVGKTINYASNYGSGLRGLLENKNLKSFDEETITKIYNAYKDNFPGVKAFSQYVQDEIAKNGYVQNVYGKDYMSKREYYKFNYKTANYMIQGTGAYVLKVAMIELDKLFTNVKSKILGSVHDEVIFEIYKDEAFLVPKIKGIMERFETKIPLKVDIEYSVTNWAEKIPLDVEKGE